MTANSQYLDFEAFQRDWEPIRAGVFSDHGKADMTCPTFSPFRDPAWTIVALPDEIHNGVFQFYNGGRDSDGWRTNDWANDNAVLFETLGARGIEEIVLTANPYWRCPKPESKAKRGQFSVCDACVCSADENTLREVLWDTSLSVELCLQVFSADGTWGLLSIHDPPYLILGGTAAFMDDYLERAGGLEAVQERFRYNDVTEGGLGRDFWRRPDRRLDLYRMLGWQAPEIPDDLNAALDWIEEWGIRLGRAHPKYMGPYDD